ADAAELAQAQETLADAEAAVAAVEGLTEAVLSLEAAEEAVTAAEEAQAVAVANLAGALAAYNTRNPAVTVTVEGEVTGLIELNDEDELVLADDVSEEENPGITALLNASVALEAAQANLAEAEDAEEAAAELVDSLDQPGDAMGDNPRLEALAHAE